MMSDPLISVDEAAAALGKSAEHVYTAVADGHWWFLGAYKSGGSYVIPRAAFARWLAGELVIGKPEERAAVRVQPLNTPFVLRRTVG